MARMSFWDSSQHNGKINAAKIKLRGVDGIIARCVIGQAERDPLYLDAKQQADGEGLAFAAYCVPWPANRNAKADAENAAEKLTPSASPAAPLFVGDDAELGASPDKHGHHLLSPEALLQYYIDYADHLAELRPDIPVTIYTAAWFWNSARLKGAINRGETRHPLWMAQYPWDPKQFPGLPPRFSKDVLDYLEINPAYQGWLVPKPWTMAQVLGIQWTSKGQGAAGGYCVSTFFDRNVMIKDVLPGPPAPAPQPPAEDELAKFLRNEADIAAEMAERMRGKADVLD
jgi:hypothetical protein